MFLAVSIWSTSPVLLRCRSSADGLVLLRMVYDFGKTLHRALRIMNPNLGKTVTPDLIVALSCKSDLELLWLIEGQGRKPRLTPSGIF